MQNQPLRKDSFWTSGLFLYILALFGIPLSVFVYQSGIDGFIARLGFNFWQIPAWQKLFAYLSTMGQAWFQMVVCIIVAGVYYRKGMVQWARLWLYSIVVYLGVGIIAYFLKCIIGRPRPKMYKEYFDPQWFEFGARLHSYPSGHTITTFAWLACLVPFYPRFAGFLMFVAATIISMGRIGITSHYTADVIFGAILGYAIATLWVKRKGFGTNAKTLAQTVPAYNGLERFMINSKLGKLWQHIFKKK